MGSGSGRSWSCAVSHCRLVHRLDRRPVVGEATVRVHVELAGSPAPARWRRNGLSPWPSGETVESVRCRAVGHDHGLRTESGSGSIRQEMGRRRRTGGQRRMENPHIHALPGGDLVVTAQGKASVFWCNGPKNPTAWKWKTRTVLERVSMEAPLPIRADFGGRLMWSDAALLARSPRDGRVWVSSPRSRSESLGPHRLPRTPCP